MRLSSVIMIGTLILASSSAGSGQRIAESSTRSYVDSASVDVELKYVQEASAIKSLLGQSGLKTDQKVIVKTLKAIDKNLARFFPNGPYTRNDFIALAWLESAFNQHEVGTSGEYGLFQIMPSEFVAWKIKGNYFDIDLNTKMGFRVLKGKYDKWQDYKKGLQAYNGIVKLKKTGKWSEKYWKAFEKRKVAIDAVLAE